MNSKICLPVLPASVLVLVMSVVFLPNGSDRIGKLISKHMQDKITLGGKKKLPSICHTSVSFHPYLPLHNPEFNTLERLPVLPLTNRILPIFID